MRCFDPALGVGPASFHRVLIRFEPHHELECLLIGVEREDARTVFLELNIPRAGGLDGLARGSCLERYSPERLEPATARAIGKQLRSRRYGARTSLHQQGFTPCRPLHQAVGAVRPRERRFATLTTRQHGLANSHLGGGGGRQYSAAGTHAEVR